MMPRIELADLPPNQRACLLTAVRCGGLLARRVGYVGRYFHGSEGSSVHAGTVVGPLVVRGLLAANSLGTTITPTDAGVALIDAGTLDREVQA